MKYVFSFIITVFVAYGMNCQTIETNEVDEFTGTSIVRTSWEVLTKNMQFSAFYRFSKEDDKIFISLKIMKQNHFSINEGDKLMIKLKDGGVLSAKSEQYEVSSLGAGARGFAGSAAPGLQLSYLITPDQLDKIKKSPPMKLRLYLSSGYVENKITPKNADVLMMALAKILMSK